MTWTKTKPIFKKDCILLCGGWFRGEFEYNAYLIKKVYFEDKWYWGWLTSDGDEVGDIEDMHSELYLILPIPKP